MDRERIEAARVKWRDPAQRAWYPESASDVDVLLAALAEAEAEVERLREAIEHDAAVRAYKAGLGGSEWEAFVGERTYEALASRPGEETAS